MIEPYDRNNFLRQARPDTIVKKKKKKREAGEIRGGINELIY